MIDSRFTDYFTDVQGLLEVLDVDDLDEVEDMFMILFDRPIDVCGYSEGGDTATGIETRVYPSDGGLVGTWDPFPTNVLALARSCADTAVDLGPYDPDGDGDGQMPDLASLNDADLINALRDALGRSRLMNMLGDV